MNAIAERQLPPSDRSDAEDKEIKLPASAGNGNALGAMHDGKYKIPGDEVNRATADLPDNQRSAIRRLHAFYMEEALSLGELANICGISQTSLSQVFRGKYPSKLDGIVESIERFFELHEKRGDARKLPFIETALTRQIWNVCKSALEFQRIGFIFGDSQTGKSEALIAYAVAHNHGSTIYVTVPTGGSLRNFLASLAKKLRISAHQRDADLRRRIIDAFDSRMLLIVDEASNCIPAERGSTQRGLQTIEFIREIFNESHCGVVICATDVFRNAMQAGSASKLLQQTNRRRLCALQLPDRPTQADLNTFAAAYKLPPATGEARELEKRMIEEEALGMWLTLLRMGAKVAAQAKKTMQWGHVISAHAGLMQLEGRK